MKIKIKVTKEILTETSMCAVGDVSSLGGYERRTSCAISKACQEIFPNCETNLFNIYFNKLTIDLPSEATKFIVFFDRSTPLSRIQMAPIDFDVEVPSDLIDSIGIDQALQIIKDSNTLELV